MECLKKRRNHTTECKFNGKKRAVQCPVVSLLTSTTATYSFSSDPRNTNDLTSARSRSLLMNSRDASSTYGLFPKTRDIYICIV